MKQIMSQQTKLDIEKALEENKGVICIQLYAEAISPDGYVHGSNPCMIESLVKLGWTER